MKQFVLWSIFIYYSLINGLDTGEVAKPPQFVSFWVSTISRERGRWKLLKLSHCLQKSQMMLGSSGNSLNPISHYATVGSSMVKKSNFSKFQEIITFLVVTGATTLGFGGEIS